MNMFADKLTDGPIPASAGEPQVLRRRTPVWRAYPRERGGTSLTWDVDLTLKGLSPRARGNRG